jgi:hypothetical protein
LQNEERPRGPAWHWASGSIELSPVWNDDGASLELRYLRSEPEDR